MKKCVVAILFIFQSGIAFAQNETGFTGKVVDSKMQKSLEYVVVSIQNATIMQLTGSDGTFRLVLQSEGDQLLLLHSQGYKDLLFPVKAISGKMVDLGVLVLEENNQIGSEVFLIALSESDLADDNTSSENTSGLLQSSRDAFIQASAFNWGQARFRMRGLDSEHAKMTINGVTMNKMYDGRPQWSNWGGLNDATRNQEFSVGAATSDYTFGGILGTQQINTRASIYRSGSRITFSGSNTNYSLRTMATYATGLMPSGWAFVVSAGKRWANEGFFEGTNYDADSFFMSIEKKLSARHALNFTGFYTPNARGKNSPNTDEVTQLTNEQYNSYWGWQNGKKRNARIKRVEEPILMLNHFFRIDDNTNLNSSVTYQFGKVSNGNIDYQNVNSPDPTHYRKLPSYYSSVYAKDQGEYPGDFTPDYKNAQKNEERFAVSSQINWKELYRANQTLAANSNGSTTSYVPAQSNYVLYEDRTDDKTISFNSNLNSQLTENIFFNGGIAFRNLKSHNFQFLTDLLGGLYFKDIDLFYKGDQSQSDLKNPNRRVGVGDSYGYNYNYLANTIDFFTQFKFTYRKVDFYLAQAFSSSTYQREGLYQNGIYPTNSFGKSEKVTFENFAFKGGITYKISGKQWLFFNGAYLTQAPSIRNTFPNARLNNNSVDGIKSMNISSVEGSYIYHAPKLKGRLTGYYSLIKNTTQTSFFYAEGIFDDGAGYDNTNAFVSQALTHLNKKNIGAELSFEYQILPSFKTTLSAAYGQYIYASNPNVTIANDAKASLINSNPVFNFGTAALKNYKQPGMPQQAYSLGAEYRNPKYWWLGANINYLANSYIDVSSISRTAQFYINPKSGLPFPEASKERAKVLLKQEKFDPISLLNITGGKSWRIRGKYISFFGSINNALNTIYKTGGFEQARNANFRRLDQQESSGKPSFGPKYFYGYGRTYFGNLAINL
ncbi:TonB-dependent receptor [Flavobacterium sp. LS1R47]|uniref:TonB-dependent receptor n=1 Tax=Flavobacterium frigoritolerans TaxID=2987686 RepID=A0A9X2ZPP5_9FLAO|nr:TonB-dependent receptor [Flavobacterium frigoritolerans]MCV9932436.1 TonB-dependent receptor [Flavobacterium frigoritolerans]